MMKTLVAYASKYGSTRGIAQCIADELTRQGIDTTLSPTDEVGSVRSYDAFIIGSALYFGTWLPGASELLESFQATLSSKPLWLFSSGPTTPGEPVHRGGNQVYPADLAALITTLHPVDTVLFSGKIDVDKLSLDDWLTNREARQADGDYRNWDEIRVWARRIAQHLRGAAHPLRT